MTTAMLNEPSRMRDSAYWKQGRLVAHIAGETAGNLRLDIEINEVPSAKEAAEHVTLVIPGELTPLLPTGAVVEDGHYVISYFSSDIANAGKLPAEAVVCWPAEDQLNRMRSVEVVSATKVTSDDGRSAVQIPEVALNRTYPTAVALVALAGAVLSSAMIVAALL